MNILTKTTVLVLNRNWQAINVRTPQDAFCMMATNGATGLEIEGEDHIRPVTWEEWLKLPIRDRDDAVHTVRGQIRVPTVIVAMNYSKVLKIRPRLCAKDAWESLLRPLEITRISPFSDLLRAGDRSRSVPSRRLQVAHHGSDMQGRLWSDLVVACSVAFTRRGWAARMEG